MYRQLVSRLRRSVLGPRQSAGHTQATRMNDAPEQRILRVRDMLYEQHVRRAGLYSVAFLGHAMDSMQRRQLNILWARSGREAEAMVHPLTQTNG